jgi:hypothetical protein
LDSGYICGTNDFPATVGRRQLARICGEGHTIKPHRQDVQADGFAQEFGGSVRVWQQWNQQWAVHTKRLAFSFQTKRKSGHQIWHVEKGASANLLVGQFGKPTLNQAEPTATSGTKCTTKRG